LRNYRKQCYRWGRHDLTQFTSHSSLPHTQDIYPELREKLETRGELECIENIAPDLLSFLVTFLEPFYNSQRELEGDKYPTINLVCLWLERLKRHCQPSPTDSPQQAFVRQRHAEFIVQKIKVNILHKVALFLWPKFNKLRMMSPVDIAEVHAHVRTLLLSVEEDAAATVSAMSSTGFTPPAARPRMDSDFAEWENQDDDNEPDEDEVAMYNSQRHTMDDDRYLLKWWKVNGLVYPKLARLARSILCIPASSSSSERVFSAAGRTIEQRRTALKPATVDAILFLHDNM
jgi:hypothetical protein